MKILLLGDYSNVHATLGKGLRELGHEVVVASDGDGWKNYVRDIDLKREDLGKWNSIKYLFRLWKLFRSFRNYDIVQLINPVFLPLRAEKLLPFYRYLRRHNKRVFLGAFGMDHYWVKTGLDCQTFRYSDFNIGNKLREREDVEIWKKDWLNGAKGNLNRIMAKDCDGIIAGLFEYYASYVEEYAEKLRFIPFPIDVDQARLISDFGKTSFPSERKVRFFVGVQKSRSSYKGTDIMMRALLRLQKEMPEEVEIVRVENVPFEQYKSLMLSCDVLLDQLYSYTPAMNALQAMAQGLIVVGGGEPENYEIIAETQISPIINVLPDEEDVYKKLRTLVINKADLPRLSQESRQYVQKHHHHLSVAEKYISFWTSR